MDAGPMCAVDRAAVAGDCCRLRRPLRGHKFRLIDTLKFEFVR